VVIGLARVMICLFFRAYYQDGDRCWTLKMKWILVPVYCI